MKRPFTLIELLLSLALFGLLLQTLFFWYCHLSSSHHAGGKDKWPLLEERYAEQQLQRIFQHTLPSPYFFTLERGGHHDLVLVFDDGLHAEPLLSDKVLGRLFIDPASHALCLGIWPHPDQKTQTPHKTLVLLENVKDLAFEFYFPPDPFQLTVAPPEVGREMPEEGWQTSWLAEYETLPPFVKMHLTRLESSSPVMYAFELGSPHPITYKQDSAS